MPATARLVAEDEEETLRRLASYRQVTDDFIAKAGGRIFNTAGDAVLAEFSSAVEAVRCAIDIQESLRTRNMAYPPSRQMSFRIGITIGDVVERDGDLLGDGVNIAARLEGLAEVGGICISRAVHEQVANKLSVQFADIGAQEVKNIPTPVHAYMVAMRREDGTYAMPQVKKPLKPPAAAPNWMWPVAVTVVCLAAIGVGGFLYFTKLECCTNEGRREQRTAGNAAPRRGSRHADRQGCRHRRSHRGRDGGDGAARLVTRAADRREIFSRSGAVRRRPHPRPCWPTNMSPAADHKALALNINGVDRLGEQPAERRSRKDRGARAVPEACRCRSVAAQMRALCASVIRSSIRTASRRCRRCRGSGTIPRSRGRSRQTRCR